MNSALEIADTHFPLLRSVSDYGAEPVSREEDQSYQACLAAINAAFELAARQAEELACAPVVLPSHEAGVLAAKDEIAKRIRALKSPAQEPESA